MSRGYATGRFSTREELVEQVHFLYHSTSCTQAQVARNCQISEGLVNNILKKEKPMKAAKADKLLNGQTSVAQRVYESVPYKTPWSAGQIAYDLKRHNHTMNLKVVSGCLYALRDSGLVREVKKGEWLRVDIREKQNASNDAPVSQEKEVPQINQATVTEIKKDPLTVISDLAEEMRSLTSKLEDAALLVSEHIQESEAKAAKLEQLQAILKGLD